MESFRDYFKNKMNDTGFRTVYDAECHVCANTMGIFEKADREKIPLARLAREVDAELPELEALRDADHCDPRLAVRLCRRLGIRQPDDCPRLG
ncbi:hypothetical protein DSCA_63190 [Desulfosarcina alkanivorans]|uniref:Uncharacterized protein n=1 Tax=Desulfosarcina alkanivorans TaxID=571177 RepID=A0A5K7YWG3_9BACT|nr:hypothetical protein [Desulfosarcina alkanivorans]BBO72389.1 hypothetical protein DSCA_63190 [Desulfosarcina alkanivorans]